ncbi:hypothetical protein BBR01nite_01470 [Brevibacillus brevis]|nr:hypothetical protein BBR01nite_01470 [Brevibacillus brevis]
MKNKVLDFAVGVIQQTYPLGYCEVSLLFLNGLELETKPDLSAQNGIGLLVRRRKRDGKAKARCRRFRRK